MTKLGTGFLLLSGALVALAGCYRDVPIGGDDGGRDAGMPPADGSIGEPCGPTTCPIGQSCCNESCGICTDPGVGCPAIACASDGGTPPVDSGPGEPCGAVTCGDGLVCCNPSCGICTPPGGSCITLECDRTCGGRGGDGTECTGAEYCAYDGGGCGYADGTGHCLPRPDACPDDCPGVCGCDGNDYCNACDAAAIGVDVYHEGSCTPMTGTVCGGFAGFTCAADEWCDYEPGDFCGAADASGICRPRPEACADIFSPVCGCDARDYGNACEAHAAGTDDRGPGTCAD